MAALTSDWTGLSTHLIATFYPVKRVKADKDNVYRWERDTSQPEVHAPITEGSIDTTINWHSPFENVGADQKWSALSALLQTGALAPVADALKNALSAFGASGFSETIESAKKAGLEGNSSVTKLNSTQVFAGLSPAKLTFTAHFRAYSNPTAEVADPVNQLLRWAHPQFLAEDSFLLAAAKGAPQGPYPSKIPQIIAMKYAGSLYQPMVIEGIPTSLTPPRDKDGRVLSAQISMTIASLSSLDARDWSDGNWAFK